VTNHVLLRGRSRPDDIGRASLRGAMPVGHRAAVAASEATRAGTPAPGVRRRAIPHRIEPQLLRALALISAGDTRRCFYITFLLEAAWRETNLIDGLSHWLLLAEPRRRRRTNPSNRYLDGGAPYPASISRLTVTRVHRVTGRRSPRRARPRRDHHHPTGSSSTYRQLASSLLCEALFYLSKANEGLRTYVRARAGPSTTVESPASTGAPRSRSDLRGSVPEFARDGGRRILTRRRFAVLRRAWRG